MSIINDALKKAQQQRAQEAAAAPTRAPLPVPPLRAPGAPPLRISPISSTPTPAELPTPPSFASTASNPPSAVRYGSSAARYTASVPSTAARPKSAPNLLLLGGGAFVLVGITVVVTIMLMRPEAEPVARPPAQATAVRPAAPTVPAPAQPAPPASTPPASPAVEVAQAPAPQATPAPVAAVPPPATPPEAPAAASPATPATAAPVTVAASAPLPSVYAPRAPTPINNAARIQSFLDRLRVSGIRITNTGSKVILNDRLFLVGEVVDSGLGLRLVRIEPDTLTFVDAQGKTFQKFFQ